MKGKELKVWDFSGSIDSDKVDEFIDLVNDIMNDNNITKTVIEVKDEN